MPDVTPVKLSFNELPWGPLPAVLDAITAFLQSPNSINRYPDMRATELRAAIAEHHGVPVECVAVGTGSSGLVHQLTYAQTGPGDEVLMPWPTFGQYAAFAAWTGATAVRVPLVSEAAYSDARPVPSETVPVRAYVPACAKAVSPVLL